jgi:two-component system sensor histidine kinase KdpD
VAIVACCTLLNLALHAWLTPTDTAMVHLLGVILAAVYFQRSVSLAAALLSVVAFNFFFVPPTLTLHIGSTRYLVTALVLLIVGLITSTLASRVRREMHTAAQAELAATDERIRSSLLASLSHDLRTPLAVIAGSASSLRENRERMSIEQQDQLLETIFQRSVSMSREVIDLLEMTRLHAGRVALDRQWYPLEELIGAALERCNSLTGTHALSVHLPEQMTLLHVDGVLIEKLLVNLIENAALHTPANSAIRIEGRREQSELIVSIQDTGKGIAPGTEASIFDKFDRGALAQKSTGSGLGLSICRAIAELHGISISARNRIEGGAEFSVRFPLETAPPIPVDK